MRSPYEDNAAAAASDLAYKYQYSYNNSSNNNNNNYYKSYNGNGSSGVHSQSQSGAIPYHARENSLPFSYGQIGKSSTPLRKTPTPTKADSLLDFDFGGSTNANGSENMRSNGNGNAIKTQPRLTSPLLVRKTLARSPTRSTAASTNTIANTYHFNGGGVRSTQPTPPREDFDQLLRASRDKVYSEYRVPPTPPQRHHFLSTNGSTPQRNGQSKYNYDFEFNLNLCDEPSSNSNSHDEVDAYMIRPRSTMSNYQSMGTRAHTLERSSLQPQMQQPYRTRNIDVVDGTVQTTSTFVERNYHTINSGAGRNGSSKDFLQIDNERPPLEVTYKRQQQQQQQAAAPPAAYGNGTGAVYGQSNMHVEKTQTQTLTRQRRDLSPIYATTTKQQQRNGNGPNTNGHQADYLTTTPSPTTPSGVGRPETPAFPVTPRTPYGLHYSTLQTQQQQQRSAQEPIYQMNTRSRLNSMQEPQEVAAHLVKFARNSAKFWYKPMLSREDAIAQLLHAPPGTFVVRDSTTYKNAYGLVVRVAQPPPGSSGELPQDLVRHFLIEPTQRGVRLKGCAEPVFTSLSALVYEHSINQLALPCLLLIPEADVVPTAMPQSAAQQQLLNHGAATNVLWLYSCDTESLTGSEAIRKAIKQLYAQQPLPASTEVHFKVTQQGITLTDNTRKKFFRKHYTADVISHCAVDPEGRSWQLDGEKKAIFAFVARRSHSSKDNQCHVFCELSCSQPAMAIVSFANRTLPTEKQGNYVL